MSKIDLYIQYLILSIALLPSTGINSKTDLNHSLNAQDKDSISQVIAISDTLPREYQRLKEESRKHGLTKQLYRLVIKEPRLKKNNETLIQSTKELDAYSGKIIRNIIIKVLPPFGTKINDPEYRDLEVKAFNDSHVVTKNSAIRGILQFKKGQELSPVLIMASEADLRSAKHIYNARINVEPIANNSDSVDVEVIVRDKWTIGLSIHNLSASNTNIEIFDANILGSGSRAGTYFIYSDQHKRKFGYGLNYLYSNIAKTGIDAEGKYIDYINSYTFGLSASRHLQPKYKYFGETSYVRNVERPMINPTWDSISPDKSEYISFTLGRAFTLSSEQSIKQFVLALRYKSQHASYNYAPHQEYLASKLLPFKYTNNKMLLLQASLYSNYYEQEHMVYNIGTTEDITLGYNIAAQLGYIRDGIFNDAVYNSISASYGTNKLLPGNIYLSSALGGFIKEKKGFGGILKVETKYFTPIKRISTMHYRQFVSVLYTKLLQPGRYLGDQIYMGQYTSLRMRDWYKGSKGIQQLLIKSETDLFTNIQVAGFHFLFYNFLDIGWISADNDLFSSNNFNYGFGLGVRLRNNFIIFNTIDLKIGIYPKLKQDNFGSYFRINSTTPEVSPNFIPELPSVIVP